MGVRIEPVAWGGRVLPEVVWREQWSGLNPFRAYNWRDFTLITVAWEWDNVCSTFEVTALLLGVGVTLVWGWDGPGRRAMQAAAAEVEAMLEEKGGKSNEG